MFPQTDEVRRRRARLGISQKRLAQEVGVSQSLIAKIESGKIKPSYEAVRRIFEYLEGLDRPRIGFAKDVHSPNVVWVSKDDGIGHAAELMRKHGFSQLPVKGELDGMCIGIVSERIIVKRILDFKKPDALYEERVEKIMEEQLPIVDEDTPLPIVASLLEYAQAVLTAKGGRIKGIITNSDLIRLIPTS